MSEKLDYKTFMEEVKLKHPHEPEFHQAVEEAIATLIPFVNENPKYRDARILERIVEPDRAVIFRVSWVDDNGNVQVNRGYRVQFNNSIGPYKGGLRFHPSVNLSILKFLGFEQIFKNSLTTLPLGGGKGGSDFDPKGKSYNEVMRFCQSFMTELSKYIGESSDIPAGDIGVGEREIGFLFGQFKRMHNKFTGVLTGKRVEYGGSLIRPEATGYGCVYFAQDMLEEHSMNIEGKNCVVSGSGNVAQYAVEKILDLGGKVYTMSDSRGMLHDKEGFDKEKLEHVKHIKNVLRAPLSSFTEKYPNTKFHPKKKPWDIPCDVAFACATQNEILKDDATKLVSQGCFAVIEGANMPVSLDALKVLKKKNVLFAPGKAANAGGVSISGLEMSQNSLRIQWTREEVDKKLRNIMRSIHSTCVKYGRCEERQIDYVKGANIGGFIKVADSMISCGVV